MASSQDSFSLRGRMILHSLVASGIFALLSGLLVFCVSWNYLMTRAHEQINLIAQDLKNEYAQFQGDLDQFYTCMLEDAREHQESKTFIILATATGQIVRATPMPQRILKRIERANSKMRWWHRFYTERTSAHDRHIAVRMRTLALNENLRITVAQDVTDVERYLLFLAITLGATFVLTVLCTGLTVSLFSARFVRGFRGIVQAASQIEAGDWSSRVSDHGTRAREVQGLVKSFNAMCDKNEKTLNELRVLTDNLAHDLRTPLARLALVAENAVNRSGENTLAETVQNETHGMLEMINMMLEISQTEAQLDRGTRAHVEVTHLVKNLVELYAPLAEQEGLSILCEVPPNETLEVCASCAKMQQLVSNLIENAIKYTSRGGCVRVHVRAVEKGCCVCVTDTGCGISETDLPHIWTRFWRADSSRACAGNGLGLALVKAIVTSLGGSISCMSTVGVGSAFEVILPRA